MNTDNCVNPSDISFNDLESKPEGKIKAMLYLLHSFLTDLIKDIDISKEVFNVGAKTQLTREIESSLKDPLLYMGKSTEALSDAITSFLNQLITEYFKSKTDIIEEAYKVSEKTNYLSYCVVLKKDNTKNRENLFQLLDKYEEYDISKNYPINFHFCRKDLMDSVNKVEKIA